MPEVLKIMPVVAAHSQHFQVRGHIFFYHRQVVLTSKEIFHYTTIVKVKDYDRELNGGVFAKFSRTYNQGKLKPFDTII